MTTKEPGNDEGPLTKAFLIVGFWLFLAVMVLLEIGRIPKTAFGWACLVIIGPVAYLAVSVVGEWLFSKRHGEMVSRSKFSIGRMAIAFFVFILIFFAAMVVDGFLSDGR